MTILPGLKAGGAWTERYFSQEIKDEILNLRGTAHYGIVGMNYSSNLLDLAGVWATQRNGDLRPIEVGPGAAQRSSTSDAAGKDGRQ